MNVLYTRLKNTVAICALVGIAPLAAMGQTSEPETSTYPDTENRLTCADEVAALRDTVRGEADYASLAPEFEEMIASAGDAAVSEGDGVCYIRLLGAQQYLAFNDLAIEGYTDQQSIYRTIGAAQNAGAMSDQAVDQARAATISVEAHPARVAVTPEAARVNVEQDATNVNVTQRPAQIMVEQAPANVAVQQAQPNIAVTQAPAGVTVDAPAPEVSVTQPKPRITVTQAQPEVAVTQTAPQVSVTQPDPIVNVDQGQAAVSVSQGEAVVTTEMEEAEVTLDTADTADVETIANDTAEVSVDMAGEAEINISSEAAEAATASVEPIAIEEVEFGFDSDEISDEGRKNIADVVELMDDDSRAILFGYASPIGDAAYNLDLSERRVTNVRDEMIDMGVDASHIIVRSLGEDDSEQPAGENQRSEENRRVEIRILPASALANN